MQFFTYGKIDITSLQDQIQKSVLHHFSHNPEKTVEKCSFFSEPRYASKNYKPFQEMRIIIMF